jgi:hypothetical protein
MIEIEIFDALILGHQEKKHHLLHVLKDLGFKPRFNQVGNLYYQTYIMSRITRSAPSHTQISQSGQSPQATEHGLFH